jgi:rhodanese-related sulfurtransferase
MNKRRLVLRSLVLALLVVHADGNVLAARTVDAVRYPVAEFSPAATQADVVTDITGIKDISCQQALKIIQEHKRDPNFVILDFRTKEMFVESHIPGAICHDVFLTDIDDWLKALDNKKVYLICCTAGHRSGIALAKMKELGFVNILHMHEGLRRWISLGYETVSGDKLSEED